jgi:hypothetical protein
MYILRLPSSCLPSLALLLTHHFFIGTLSATYGPSLDLPFYE